MKMLLTREKLFSFKLTVFEYDELKNSDTSERSKKAKTAIRKAQRPEHILALYSRFLEMKMQNS
jgi:hypothetical protein